VTLHSFQANKAHPILGIAIKANVVFALKLKKTGNISVGNKE
jgi:hypothetical protein